MPTQGAGPSSLQPNGPSQPGSQVPSRESSVPTASSHPSPLISKHMAFGNSVDLINIASKALRRDRANLDIKEVPHPVFPNQRTCTLYCKNYAFAQNQTTARGWSSLVPRLGLGGGNQPSKCMAFVEAIKKSDNDQWYVCLSLLTSISI